MHDKCENGFNNEMKCLPFSKEESAQRSREIRSGSEYTAAKSATKNLLFNQKKKNFIERIF